jgi:hypothetical protein
MFPLLIAQTTNTFWTGIGIAATGWLIPILIGVLSIVAFSFLARQGKDKVQSAKQALMIVKAFLGRRLGDKAGAVIDAWLIGIKSIEDGSLSVEDGVETFVNFVVIAAQNNGVSLSEDEIAVIREALQSTLESLDIKAKPTQKAVTIMMAENV